MVHDQCELHEVNLVVIGYVEEVEDEFVQFAGISIHAHLDTVLEFCPVNAFVMILIEHIEQPLPQQTRKIEELKEIFLGNISQITMRLRECHELQLQCLQFGLVLVNDV